jgi:uncharacterized protein DUF6295
VCTTIMNTIHVHGAGTGRKGWFNISEATVAYDHPSSVGAEHALLIDFANYDLGTDARLGVELDLASGRALLAQLQQVIAAADAAALE